MYTHELLVVDRSVRPNSKSMSIVRTSVGIDDVRILFDDPEWLEFPVTITFASEQDTVTQTIVLSEIQDSQYVAEAYATIPWEVLDENGSVRVTLQGTDSQGRHIVTAKGEPLSVVEAGDIVAGDAPSETPTVDQWQQAYADAMEAVNQAASLVSTLQGRLDAMVSDAAASLDDEIASLHAPATYESLGQVKVGAGLDISESGELAVAAVTGITSEQSAQIANLAALAYYCFDTEFDQTTGELLGTAKAKASALPLATVSSAGAVMPDGQTVTVDRHGLISSRISNEDFERIVSEVVSRLSE